MRFLLQRFFENSPRSGLNRLLKMLAFIFLFSALPKMAQAQQGIDYDIAESYFHVGQYEKAAELFKKLYDKKPDGVTYFERYRECLYRLGKFDELIVALRKEIPRQPHNISIRLQLAQVYYKKRETKKADATIEELCTKYNRLAVYRRAIKALEQVKAFPQVIKIVTLARRQFHKNDLFVQEAARANLFLSKYSAATVEYLKLLQGEMPAFSTVRSNILSYAVKDNPEVLKQTIETLDREKEDLSGISRQLLSNILSALYFEAGDYKGAFEEANYLDRETNAFGRELLSFANSALAKKKYNEAILAYDKAIERSTSSHVAQEAILGKANARMSLAKLAPDSAAAQRLTAKTYATYVQFTENYPGSRLMPQVLLAIAKIENEALNQPTRALRTLQSLTDKYANLPEGYWAEYEKANIFVHQNQLGQAAELLSRLNQNAYAKKELKADAKLLLGQVLFYEQKYALSLQTLGEISLSMKASNNALALKLLIFEGISDTLNYPAALEALGAFSCIKKLIAQKKYPLALDSLAQWLERHSYSSLSDNALFENGLIQAKLAPSLAIDTFKKIVANFPESFFADKSLFELGKLHETALNDQASAIGFYQQLIQKYPKSLLTKEARNRLRALRQSQMNG